MAALGAGSLPLLVVQHPLGGEQADGVSLRVAQAVEQLAALLEPNGSRDRKTDAHVLTGPTRASAQEVSRTIELPEDEVYAQFVARDWCDGLPIVAPTRERVDVMLGRADGSESLGVMPPLWRECTIEKLAVNSVMAGCEPAYFPVIVAAVRAMLDPAFNLYGVQATTHPVAPLVIVSGPRARAIGLHSGAGLFGPGFRANATMAAPSA